MSDKSSKNDEKGRYLKSYNMYEHDGTFEGHKKWRRAGAVFFEAKKQLFVLSLILTGAFDPTPLITTWPYEPEDWKPVSFDSFVAKNDFNTNDIINDTWYMI